MEILAEGGRKVERYRLRMEMRKGCCRCEEKRGQGLGRRGEEERKEEEEEPVAWELELEVDDLTRRGAFLEGLEVEEVERVGV